MQPTITSIELQQLASGDRLALQVYKFVGAQPGKKAYVQANLHGCEIVGNAAIFDAIEYLGTLDAADLCGEIWLVPTCNPPATNQRGHFFSTGRYNPYDGRDWNRIFWDYTAEAKDLPDFARDRLDCDPDAIRGEFVDRIRTACDRAHGRIGSHSSLPYRERYRYRLQSLCLDANYLIDLHASSNRGREYLYCFQSREASAPDFLIDCGVLMPTYDGFAFDEAFMKPWLALEAAFADLGRTLQFDVEAWTLELGAGSTIAPASRALGTRGILNYLARKGMLALPDLPLPAAELPDVRFFTREQIRHYHAPVGGMAVDRLDLGTIVRAGDLLYRLQCFDRDGNLPHMHDVRAEADGLVFDIAVNQSANQGDYVLSILEDESK
ncbi:succinylglutamate desuccinylase/aspartoacylase family protein [Rubidibacter lacunae]|uniref:succinylglutamate desuccinylase/aspartoacylase family protein n=1 Tax=Rubidibacter lacunae TaxID=582514 RepID=UPI0003FCBA48|nr:succinylglutamate desuccinylase/aspartoacylase family protein [Rubidibacter lacunae]